MAQSTQVLYVSDADVKTIMGPKYTGTTSDVNVRIRDASAYIDSRLKKTFSVPFPAFDDTPPTPEEVNTLAKETAAAMLRRDNYQGDRRDIPADEPLVPVWITEELSLLKLQETDLATNSANQKKAYFVTVEEQS